MKKVGAWSSFPPPPAYVELFRDGADTQRPPPPPPISGHYMLFGQPLTTEMTFNANLSEQGCTQLFSVDERTGEPDMKEELRKLNRSLVFCYYEFLQMLVHRADGCDEKLKDLESIQINIHYLLNSYRPRQARLVVRDTMQHQVDLRSAQCKNIQDALQFANDTLRQCVDTLGSSPEHGAGGDRTDSTATADEADAAVVSQRAPPASAQTGKCARRSDLALLQQALEEL